MQVPQSANSAGQMQLLCAVGTPTLFFVEPVMSKGMAVTLCSIIGIPWSQAFYSPYLLAQDSCKQLVKFLLNNSVK